MTEAEQEAWYVKQLTNPKGSKRKFDEITYQEASVREVFAIERGEDHLHTWTVFKRNGLIDGFALGDLERQWQELTEGPNTEAIWRRNQWLIPVWDGIRRGRELRDGQRSEATRGTSVGSSEELANLQAGGGALLDQFAASIRPAVQVTPQQPATAASVADQPAYVAPSDIISQQIHREAMFPPCFRSDEWCRKVYEGL